MLAGDIASLGLLSANLRRLARVPARVATGVADRLAALVEEEFDAGADPYGNAWEPLTEATLRKHPEPPLTDTRGLRDELAVKAARGAGVQITMREYAAFHQTGFRVGDTKVPPRPVLPAAGFPARWSEVIKAELEAQAEEAMR